MFLNKFKNLFLEKRLPDLKYWLKNYRKLLVHSKNLNKSFWNLIDTEPIIIYTMPFSINYESLYKATRNKKTYILKSNPWIPRNKKQAKELRDETKLLNKKYKNIDFVYLCNEASESEILKQEGLSAYYCNQNCFLDETIYKPQYDAEKKFDAIYDAQIVPYKRHDLAIQVKNLALNGYISSITENIEYTNYVRENFLNHHWFQNPFISKDKAKFEETEVCDFINQCKVGLCLSSAEGGMYASAQYLLCGLPVVTTKNIGGRNTFFHSDYALEVDEKPALVQEAVKDLIQRKINPQFIRQKAVNIQKEHRQFFFNIINQIYASNGLNKEFSIREWNNIFIHKMGTMRFNNSLLNEIKKLNRVDS